MFSNSGQLYLSETFEELVFWVKMFGTTCGVTHTNQPLLISFNSDCVRLLYLLLVAKADLFKPQLATTEANRSLVL